MIEQHKTDLRFDSPAAVTERQRMGIEPEPDTDEPEEQADTLEQMRARAEAAERRCAILETFLSMEQADRGLSTREGHRHTLESVRVRKNFEHFEAVLAASVSRARCAEISARQAEILVAQAYQAGWERKQLPRPHASASVRALHRIKATLLELHRLLRDSRPFLAHDFGSAGKPSASATEDVD